MFKITQKPSYTWPVAVEFPVKASMAQFMSEQRGQLQPGVSKYNREGLLAWAREPICSNADSASS